MPTRQEVEQLIQQTLNSTKKRLSKNVEEGKEFWKDDEFVQGLQNRCEGLEIFLIPHLDKPQQALEYFSTEDLKKEINEIYQTVNKKGFVAEPYLVREFDEKGVTPPDFIDVVSYALTAAIHARTILGQIPGGLDEKTEQQAVKLINKCLSWLIESHITNEGWSGLARKTVSHIYATWVALDCLPEVKGLGASAPIETGLIEKYKEATTGAKEWLMKFANMQKGVWESDTSSLASPSAVYSVYGLNSLLTLEVHKDKPELVKGIVRGILRRWSRAKSQFLLPTHHFFFTKKEEQEAPRIEYLDESILVISLFTLARVRAHLELEKELAKEIDGALESMYRELVEGRFDKERGLWHTGVAQRPFSLYVTERTVEALFAYKETLLIPGPSHEELTRRIYEKMGELEAKISDIHDEERTKQIYEKIDSLDANQKKIADTLVKLMGIVGPGTLEGEQMKILGEVLGPQASEGKEE